MVMLFDYSKVLFVFPRGDKMSNNVYLTIDGDGVINLEISDYVIAKPSLPIDILYTELLTLQSVGMLTPEQKYRITDFKTTIQYDAYLPVYVGALEPLIVTALNTNTLDRIAFSELYPTDIIHYQLGVNKQFSNPDFSPYTGEHYGLIYHRSEPGRDITAPIDWRNAVVRLYETAFMNGIYMSSGTTLGDERFILSPMFPALSPTGAVNIFANILIQPMYKVGMQPHVVLHSGGRKVEIGKEPDHHYFWENVSQFKSGTYAAVYAYKNIEALTMGSGVVTLRGTVNGCLFGDASGVEFLGNLSGCQLMEQFIGVVAGDHTNELIGYPNSAYAREIVGQMDLEFSSSFLTAQTIDDQYIPHDISTSNIVILRGNGGTFYTSTLLNFPDHPVTFKAQPGYTFTLIVTPFASVTANNRIMADANIVLIGNQADEVTFKKVTITNVNGTFSVLQAVYGDIDSLVLTKTTAAPELSTPVDATIVPVVDGGLLKWLSWANVKAALTSLFCGSPTLPHTIGAATVTGIVMPTNSGIYQTPIQGKAAQGLSFAVFPLIFVSSAYVPVETMPGWLQPIAANQPVTAMVGSVRSLVLGGDTQALLGHSTTWFVVHNRWVRSSII